MQNEEETKKHSKVITFSLPKNRFTKHMKNHKNFMKTKKKTTNNTFKQQHE